MMSEPQGHYGYEPAPPNPYVQQQVNPYDQPPTSYYPQPIPYGYQALVPEHPQSTTVFVLGLVGFLIAGLTAPFALIMGRNARREMASQPGRYRDSGLLTAGWVMGIIGTIYLGLVALLFIGYLIFFVIFAVALAGSVP